MSDANNNNPQKLSGVQKRLVENLGDETYTVAYIEEWMNRQDDVISNAPAALTSMGVHGYLRAIKNMEREYDSAEADQKNNDNGISREHLIAFAEAAIEELGLSGDDVGRYVQGAKRKCFDCGCLHLYIDRFCPECGVLACEGEESQ